MKESRLFNLHKIECFDCFVVLNNLALTYEEGGKYNEAIKTFQESLELKRRCDYGNLVEMSTST